MGKRTLSSIGEFGFIERISRRLKLDSQVLRGSGDDCAVLKLNRAKYMLATCDMIVEGVDFRKNDNPYLIGRKALAVSISDIAACAGRPRFCLVSIVLPKKTKLSFLDALCRGLIKLAEKYKINIIGGDLSAGDKLAINTTLLGEVEKKNLTLRSGAKPKEIIFVSGCLGGSRKGKHLNFTPRAAEARFLVKNFKISSMIDISDGLLQDLGQILKKSRVGALLFEELIPVSKQAVDLNDALTSGEDFELLFTMPAAQAKKILNRKLKSFTPVGIITEKRLGFRLAKSNNQVIDLIPKGFKHF